MKDVETRMLEHMENNPHMGKPYGVEDAMKSRLQWTTMEKNRRRQRRRNIIPEIHRRLSDAWLVIRHGEGLEE